MFDEPDGEITDSDLFEEVFARAWDRRYLVRGQILEEAIELQAWIGEVLALALDKSPAEFGPYVYEVVDDLTLGRARTRLREALAARDLERDHEDLLSVLDLLNEQRNICAHQVFGIGVNANWATEEELPVVRGREELPIDRAWMETWRANRLQAYRLLVRLHAVLVPDWEAKHHRDALSWRRRMRMAEEQAERERRFGIPFAPKTDR
jgi:hypothetical protein